MSKIMPSRYIGTFVLKGYPDKTVYRNFVAKLKEELKSSPFELTKLVF